MTTDVRSVLAVNPGSTSVKVSLVGAPGDARSYASLDAAVAADLAPDVVAYRVVHGGARTQAAAVDDLLLAELAELVELAPLHQPAALEAIERGRAEWPAATHVACFDTAFHASIPTAARTYALPSPWREQLPVYGFHGLSHAWASSQALAQVPGSRRVLVAHLGGGASLCGVLDGRSVVTTMGFTPLDGLVMATRAGSLDPGAVLWLVQHSREDVAGLLDRRSGLLGLAGTSDMREVTARADEGDAAARLALDVYEHRFVLLAGGCVAVLGGVDVVAFTGGVGEHAAGLRDRLVRRLGPFGVGGPAPVLVVPAREDLQMAAEARALVG